MAQLKDLIVNGASRFIGDIFGNNATFSGDVMPETDNVQSLGDSTHRWKLYGVITGSLDKTFKIKLNNTQYTYNGSANVDLSTIYAPTAGGTANTQALVGNGATTAPKWVNISPSISITPGTDSATPKVNVTVLGQSGTTAQAITTATTGVYGATKLTDAYTSTDATLAATGKSILAAIQTLDVSAVGGGTGEYISKISETDGKIVATKTTTTVSNTWTDGTTAGPTIKTTVNGINGTAVAIPSASASVSGVVTTAAQTFAGDKTFQGNVFPAVSDSYNLGSTALRWKFLYGVRGIDLTNTGATGITVNNTDIVHSSSYKVDATGLAGIYDDSHTFWVLSTDQPYGDTWLKSKADRNIIFERNGTENARFDTTGHFIPGTTETFNLGSTTKYWNNAYIKNIIYSSGEANRLVWTDSDKLLKATNHYADATSIAINSTTIPTPPTDYPTYNLYINGDARSSGDLYFEGTNNKLAAFKLTTVGTVSRANIDMGWDWEKLDGAGAAFRSTDQNLAANQIGRFVLFARTTANDTTQLVGAPTGELSWKKVSGAARIGINTDADANSILFVNDGRIRIDSANQSGDGTGAFLTLNSTNTTFGGFYRIIEHKAPNLQTGKVVLLALGKDTANGNQGYFGFTYNGDSSNDNFITLGMNNNDHLVRIYKTGNVSIGEANNNYKLYVNGTSYHTDGIRIVRNSASADTGPDSILYIENKNSNDWGIKLNKETTNYGLYIQGTGTELLQVGTNAVLRVHDHASSAASRRVNINGRLELNRSGNAAYGRISFYSSAYYTWIDYMSDATNGACPTGGKPGTLGNVTGWARRSIIENNANYGWTWEAAKNEAASANTVQPTTRMALSSNDGTLTLNGKEVIEYTNTWLTPSRLQLGRYDTTAATSDRAIIGVTDGNLHIDSYDAKEIYLQYYASNKYVRSGHIRPLTNNAYNLGDSSLKWANIYMTTAHGALDGNATTSSYPQGFTGRSTGETWGNTVGTSVTVWSATNGGTVAWRYDNPQSGQLSMKVDGTVYINEGQYPVLAQKTANGFPGLFITAETANHSQTVYNKGWNDTGWLRTTSNGFIPYQSGGPTAGHSSLGTSSWYFANAYIQNAYLTNIQGRLTRAGVSSSWWNQRDCSMLYMSSINGLSPGLSLKTTNGSWSISTYNNSNAAYLDRLLFSYVTDANYSAKNNTATTGVSITSAGVLMGAAWNDYAEFRQTKEEIEPGRCIREIGDDTLEITTKRLERGCEIVSDTYGFAIGETDKSKIPIAASGRVLAYPYESREEFASHIGWPVCSGPNGTVSIMTEEEEEKYPSRIIGTISAVPDYEEWGTGNVKVNGRVWIRIR